MAAGDETGFDQTDRRRTETPPSSSRPHKIRRTAQTHEARARSSISALLSQQQHQTQPQTHEGDYNEHLREAAAAAAIVHLHEGLGQQLGGKASTDTNTNTNTNTDTDTNPNTDITDTTTSAAVAVAAAGIFGGREDSIPSSDNVLRVLLEETPATTGNITKTTTPSTMDQKISYVPVGPLFFVFLLLLLLIMIIMLLSMSAFLV